MNSLEACLYKTRKNALECAGELGYNNVSEVDIGLSACSDCGIWLKPKEMKKDLDGLPICKDCLTYHGL